MVPTQVVQRLADLREPAEHHLPVRERDDIEVDVRPVAEDAVDDVLEQLQGRLV
jgi:hypothetical protein